MGVVALLVWHSGLMEAFRVRTFFFDYLITLFSSHQRLSHCDHMYARYIYVLLLCIVQFNDVVFGSAMI